MKRAALLFVVGLASSVFAQRPAPTPEKDVVITGGWMFSSVGNDRVRNPGLLVRAGKILRV